MIALLLKPLHARIQNALKPSGVFLLAGYAKEQLCFNPDYAIDNVSRTIINSPYCVKKP